MQKVYIGIPESTYGSYHVRKMKYLLKKIAVESPQRFGSDCIEVPVDDKGRLLLEHLADLDMFDLLSEEQMISKLETKLKEEHKLRVVEKLKEDYLKELERLLAMMEEM